MNLLMQKDQNTQHLDYNNVSAPSKQYDDTQLSKQQYGDYLREQMKTQQQDKNKLKLKDELFNSR